MDAELDGTNVTLMVALADGATVRGNVAGESAKSLALLPEMLAAVMTRFAVPVLFTVTTIGMLVVFTS